MAGYSYSEYSGGPDPLAPPYDVRAALDQLGEDVLAGESPSSALRDLLRRGMSGDQGQRGRGLDDLLRRVRERQREIRDRGRLDGVLDQARALLDKAIGQERAELFPDPGDDARMREAELDALPSDTSQAIRRLADYQWKSPAARETFEQLNDLLRREVLDSQFRGMKQALQAPDAQAMQRVKDMLAALNQMLEADARGDHTQDDFDRFMAEYGDLFPDNPADLEQLVNSLARRVAAAQRLLDSLSEDQRNELAGLMSQTLDDAGLAAEMAQLADALRARRPDLDAMARGGDPMTGDQPLGLGDATTALAELADLADLESALRQDYPGARLDDVDEEAVRRALGRQALDDMSALKQIQRELEKQGYLRNEGGTLELTPKAVRRLGETALRRVFAQLGEGGPGEHEQHDAGQAGDPTGSTRPWEFGDELAIDAAATVRSALLRGGTPGGTATARTAAGWPRPGQRAAGQRRGGRRRGGRHRHPGPAVARGLPGRRNRTPHRGRRLPAGQPVLLDGAPRHLGRGQADGAGPARPDPQQVPAGRHPGHRLLQLRARAARDRPGRARLGHGAGHQPAPCAGARRALPGPAPRARARRHRRDRRRAHGSSAAGRALLVRLAAVAGDPRADPGRGG